jgi:hypothetical protein
MAPATINRRRYRASLDAKRSGDSATIGIVIDVISPMTRSTISSIRCLSSHDRLQSATTH